MSKSRTAFSWLPTTFVTPPSMPNLNAATQRTIHPFRFVSLAALLPRWAARYILPKSCWSLKECIGVQMVHCMTLIVSLCGIPVQSTDKTRQVSEAELKTTSFVWLEPAVDSLIKGVAKDGKVGPMRISGYVWPKGSPLMQGEHVNGLSILENEAFAKNIIEHSQVKHVLCVVPILFPWTNSDGTSQSTVDYRPVHESCHPAQFLDAISAYSYLPDISTKRKKVLPMPGALMVFFALAGYGAPKESYTGYPKNFISIGDAEAYQREREQLAEQMRGGSVDVTPDVQKDVVHDLFGMALPVIPSEIARAQVLENGQRGSRNTPPPLRRQYYDSTTYITVHNFNIPTTSRINASVVKDNHCIWDLRGPEKWTLMTMGVTIGYRHINFGTWTGDHLF
ncbi:uncharacterized protein EV420DRAFT_1479311 [Desarmillaria tabescens]|uniref:Uncharacterized protein n=1 Tax=Armillaria tabescens TaxID=1929756 RepID=A0AA39N653_ARMTA|nr:uncharacterized protein EV420DRAFT_1479311 [Desarmillaria tabescens]KAK0459317.1 hypothetical protein EV420DRAFT_1479311 [Desarmillaria tabescens]